jgi:hypothetical protein
MIACCNGLASPLDEDEKPTAEQMEGLERVAALCKTFLSFYEE